MDISRILCEIAVMAGVTYLIRMLPLTIFTRKIKSNYVRSFLFYVPYAVLGAMTFPAIFFSTDGLLSAIAGTVVALLLAFREKDLLTVALCACGTAFAAQLASCMLAW